MPDRTVLLAALEAHAQEVDQLGALLAAGPLAPTRREELGLLARAVIQVHDRQMPTLVAVQAGGEQTADLAVLGRTLIVDRGHAHAVEWLRAHIADGNYDEGYDAEAVAVVAIGSLLAYAAERYTFGAPPLGVDEDRFVDTWVETWMRVASSADAERAEADSSRTHA